MMLSSRTTRPAVLTAAVFTVIAAGFMAPGLAADTEPPPTSARPSNDPLANARKLVAAKMWPMAINELQRINATTSADWNNLMGFAHRKASPPDLAAAERHYEAALRIDANHRGALEYSGELALMQGNLARAEQRLAALDKACAGKCEELEDLKGAIARYKAQGNKYIAKN